MFSFNKKILNNIISSFYLFFFTILLLPTTAKANANNILSHLQQAYPNDIQSVNENYITWQDGTRMAIGEKNTNKSMQEKLDFTTLFDQLNDAPYPMGKPVDFAHFKPVSDPGRVRYTPFFMKMYGQTATEVKSKLTTIYWMEHSFGKKYPLQVTTVNAINEKLMLISDELELLVKRHPEFLRFLENPGGTFLWRNIKNTHRLSVHSFGIAIDINSQLSNYWQTDLQKAHKPVSENTKLIYKNNVPWEIVEIFEKHGFIWGGKWYHYDTMHFEYRPELLVK
ncbi:MAG TPA: M15 family metallopeptidase [Gammaproteobacteria bacterium]|jgi:hypothetical protein|nr:M15 family metallopeptidase [Gammaproteobacteria bacterium]